jgi:DNA polymerase elongation subunit (family B)
LLAIESNSTVHLSELKSLAAAQIRDCQEEILQVLGKASNSTGFHELLPSALQILKKHVEALNLGRAEVEDLIIQKRLSKKPCEYEDQASQAIASQHLKREGLNIHAGQTVRYLIVNNRANVAERYQLN